MKVQKFCALTSGFTLALLSLLVCVTTAIAQGAASTPVSYAGITPYIIAGSNPGGLRTCAEVGTAFFGDQNYYQFNSGKVDYNGVFSAAFPAGLTVLTDGKYVSWSSEFGIGAIIVFGGGAANVYVYNPQQMSDSGLASPPNRSGNPADLGNITFCWNPESLSSQWCSPGYWRQTHHLDSWEATGISPDEKYNDYFSFHGDTIAGDPTLWEVLQSPQTYGGDAFNNVGDLLSAAHPDVNFLGVRVADSCPLN